MTKVILEIDAAVLGDALKSRDMDRRSLGALCRNIRELMYSQ